MFTLTSFILAVVINVSIVNSKDCGGAPGWQHACVFIDYMNHDKPTVCELIFFPIHSSQPKIPI
jgi:hypothetical protein